MVGLVATYEIGPFRLDAAAKAVTHAGAPLALGPRAVAVLALLVESAQEYVPKTRLMEEAWPGVIVEEANLSVQISALRRALAQAPGGEKWIETLARRGYRFVGPVTRLVDKASRDAESTSQRSNFPEALTSFVGRESELGEPGKKPDRSEVATAEPATPPLALPDKPSIAVLPFQNMSGDPEQDYFADGMVEEITTALSRIRWIFVIARNSSFTYKGRAVDVKRVGRELGVRYVLEGSVRRAGQRVRIGAQLVDATTGAHLWADQFDGAMEDVFDLQNQVAVSVAGIIEPALQIAETLRSAARPTSDLTAYDLYLRGFSISQSWDKEATVLALDMFREALMRDPHYGVALACAARCHQDLHADGPLDPESHRREGVDLARKALGYAADDPTVLCHVGIALAYFGEDIDASIELLERALALNPSFARGWLNGGLVRLWAGQPEAAIKYFETSLRLSPRAYTAGPILGMGIAHFMARRFENAKTIFLRSLQEKPNWLPTRRFLAACYAHLGQLDEAREEVRYLRTITTVVVPSLEYWRRLEDRELFLSGLRLAAGDAV